MQLQTKLVIALLAVLLPLASASPSVPTIVKGITHPGEIVWEAYDRSIEEWQRWPEASQAHLRDSYTQYLQDPSQPHSYCIEGVGGAHWTVDWNHNVASPCKQLSEEEVDKVGPSDPRQKLRKLRASVHWTYGDDTLFRDVAYLLERAYYKWILNKEACPCIQNQFKVLWDQEWKMERCGAKDPTFPLLPARRVVTWEVDGESITDPNVDHVIDDEEHFWWIKWVWFGFGTFFTLCALVLFVMWLRYQTRTKQVQLLTRYGLIVEEVQPGMVVLSSPPEAAHVGVPPHAAEAAV